MQMVSAIITNRLLLVVATAVATATGTALATAYPAIHKALCETSGLV